MSMTPRMKQIFRALLETKEAMPVKELAQKVGVSKRTIQRELEYIDVELKPYGVQFISKPGLGVWLEGKEEDKRVLAQDVSDDENIDPGNRKERRKRLVLELLREKGLKKLYYYSSRFGVSEATISADLDHIQGWLRDYDLTVIRKPGKGIFIEGSEDNYRKAIRAFIHDNIDSQTMRHAYEETERVTSYEYLKRSTIGQILNDDIMERVVQCLHGIDHVRMRSLTESSFIGLVIHISIAIHRIIKNEVIDADTSWMDELQEDADFLLAKRIVHELEEEFEIQIPDVEISYVCIHIKGAKHESIQISGNTYEGNGSREIQQLLNKMIDAFDDEKSYLLKQDDEFIQGLLAHLQPTLIRLSHRMQIRNPILDDIQKSYPEIYQKCVKVGKVLEEETNRQVPDAEIGFLTVHFGAALVRMEERKEKIRIVHVGVVCSSGIGISRLMSTKLEKSFHDQLQIVTYGKNDITPFVVAKTDFFVSSIAMEPVEAEIVFVNPLLNEEDMDSIRRMIYRYQRLPEKNKEEDSFAVELDEISLVATQIQTITKHMDLILAESDISFEKMLLTVSERMSPYSDRQEKIRDDLRKREQLSTQVFAEFGFALLHTRTEGVTRPAFSICMTKELGSFTDSYFKGITVVFVMLVPNDENVQVNNDILGYISTMLIEEYDFMDIVTRGNKEEIRGALYRYLKKYFNQYLARSQ